jgi:hypothetical protein
MFSQTARDALKLDPSVDDSSCYTSFKQFGELGRGHRVAEEEALSFSTVVGLKEFELLSCFNPLGNDALIEALAHANYGADDCRGMRIASNLVDK